MENYDSRRRQANEDPRRYSHHDDQGRERETWRPDDDRNRRRARGEETGWLDYDRNYGRSEQRAGDRGEQRYERGGSERSSFSPDWSREGAEPFRSDEPYYARNRDRGGSEDYSRSSSGDYSRGWRPDDDRSRWDERSRQSIPREQHQMAERSRSGDYYSPDWPYERGNQSRDQQRSGEGRYMQRGSEDEQGSHYRGYYSRSSAPFAYPGGQGYLYSESITLHGPYAGRGPKGYKRSDQQIIEEACQRLERDGDIDASEIEVTAEDGIIRLRGTVPDRRTKRRAEECVESVYGARDVMNELRCASQAGQRPQHAEEWQGSQASQGSQEWQSSQASQKSQEWQGSQSNQGSQGSQRAQGSQTAQSGQSSRGSQASQGSQQSASMPRGGTSGSGSEQSGEDKKSPAH
jgi:hypothetical protein